MPLDGGVLSNKNIPECQPHHPSSGTYSTRRFSLKPLAPDQQRRGAPSSLAAGRGARATPKGRPAAFRETKARPDRHARSPRAPRRPRVDRTGPCLSVCSQLDAFQLEDHLGRNGHATGRVPLLLAVHPQVTAAHRTGELLGPLRPPSGRGSGASGGRLPTSAPMMPARARAAAGPLRRAAALALPGARGAPTVRAV